MRRLQFINTRGLEQKPTAERSVRNKRKFSELFLSSKGAGLNSPSKAAGLNSPRKLLLDIVIKSCSRIVELEIGTFNDVTVERTLRIDGEDLSHISQCKFLKKLTFANFNITDGVFLEEVFQL